MEKIIKDIIDNMCSSASKPKAQEELLKEFIEYKKGIKKEKQYNLYVAFGSAICGAIIGAVVTYFIN